MTNFSDSSKNGKPYKFEESLCNQVVNGDLDDREMNDSSLAQTPLNSRNSRPKNKTQRPGNKRITAENELNGEEILFNIMLTFIRRR